VSLLAQGCALGNAEAVLFVDDCEPQIPEGNAFLNQRMGADDDTELSCCDLGAPRLLL